MVVGEICETAVIELENGGKGYILLICSAVRIVHGQLFFLLHSDIEHQDSQQHISDPPDNLSIESLSILS